MLIRKLSQFCAALLIVPGVAWLDAQNQPPKASGEAQLLELERHWVDAEVKHDANVLNRILDDRFVLIGLDGRTQDKVAFIAAILKSSAVSQTISDEDVRIFGDTAVSMGTDTVKRADGKASSIRCTVVYAKRGGKWRPVAEQLGPVPAPPKQ